MHKKASSIGASFKGHHIVSLDQFSAEAVMQVMKKTAKLKKSIEAGAAKKILDGALAALLFYEPSSRTFSSFATAVKRLGGQTVEYQNPLQTSSAVKGETLADTVRVFANYSDLIIMRHFSIGAAQEAAFFSPVPVINAGDGAGEHPTQALLDMYTLYEEFGTLDNLKGVLVGDLLYGRTIHSLIKGFSLFKNLMLYLLSPKNLRLDPAFVKSAGKKIKLIEIQSERDIPRDAHFWYWTRVQKERFKDLAEYERVKHAFIITPKLLRERGNKQMIIMHPLPRVGEIETAIDSDPRARYLTTQVKNGMYVRMTLVSLVLGRL